MSSDKKKENCGCCRVEALINVDERGQMVLPKDVREAAGIKPGDKLALVLLKKDGKVCCINLIKADELADIIRDNLGPLMKDIIA